MKILLRMKNKDGMVKQLTFQFLTWISNRNVENPIFF